MMTNAMLVSALQRLAMPAREQVRYLNEIGANGSADELGLEFDEAATGASLSPDAKHRVSVLDAYLTRISGPTNAQVWTFEALRTSAEWKKVRRLAREALAAVAS